MIRKIILMIALLSVCTARAQIAKWAISPRYDEISRADCTNLIIADSLDKKIIFSQEGRRLAETSDILHPFEEDMSVVVMKESIAVTGLYDKEGAYTKLSGFNMAYSYPYFSNGFLLVKEGNFFVFIDKNGKIRGGRYENAFPFFNGYASCRIFQNVEKEKDPYNVLLTEGLEKVKFSYGGKVFDDNDINFISSVNDENIGIVVAKHRVYFFSGLNKSLTPVFPVENETNIKNQAKLEDEVSLCLTRETDSTSVLRAKCGKTGYVSIRFDSFLKPVTFTSSQKERIYKKKLKEKIECSSSLKMKTKDGRKYGIDFGNQEILPPQLDDSPTCFNDMAFAKLHGKYGMLKVLKDETFKVTINKGNPIDFRHQKYETVIRLDLPREISAYNTRIEVDPESGCEVDMTSGEKKDTEFGNYIQYNCVLNIPYSLPDEMYSDERNEIVYPTQVVYDDLKSPMIPYRVKAWHYKYFNVDVNDAETSVSQGNLSFTFNINAERNPGEAVYPTNVNIQADTLKWELEKMSETRYKCKVFALNEGSNNIVVQILEQGCPPASFPFELFYTKPSAKKNDRPAVKERVVIRKRTKRLPASVPAPVPHLEI